MRDEPGRSRKYCVLVYLSVGGYVCPRKEECDEPVEKVIHVSVCVLPNILSVFPGVTNRC